MKTKDFAEELKKLDDRLEIIPNPNRAGLSNVKLGGKDICPVPSEDIREEIDHSYRYEFPNGMMARHNSRQEVLGRVKQVLESIKTPDGYNSFFND